MIFFSFLFLIVTRSFKGDDENWIKNNKLNKQIYDTRWLANHCGYQTSTYTLNKKEKNMENTQITNSRVKEERKKHIAIVKMMLFVQKS